MNGAENEGLRSLQTKQILWFCNKKIEHTRKDRKANGRKASTSNRLRETDSIVLWCIFTLTTHHKPQTYIEWACYIDYVAFVKQKICFFFLFDCIDAIDLNRALADTAERKRKMKTGKKMLEQNGMEKLWREVLNEQAT